MTQVTTPPPPAPPAPEPDEAAEQRKAFVRLAIAGVVLIALASAVGIVRGVLMALALLLMIMLHELGHFVMAKRADMKATEFFVGFGKRLWSVRKGETEYGIKALPLGGYVKVIGMTSLEEVAPEDEPRTYRQKGYWARLSVAVAGSTVHMILAFVLLWSVFAFVGEPVTRPVVQEVSKLQSGQPTPAELAGFQPGDRIVAYDGTPLKDWRTIQTYIQERPGTPIRFDVVRNGSRLTLTATPLNLQDVQVEGVPAADKPVGFVGIGPTTENETQGVIGSVGRAGSELWMYTKGTVVALGNIFSLQGLSDYADTVRGGDGDASNRFLSPVGFVRVASQAADQGWAEVLTLLALINVFVGLFNMIPMLPFDGGHVAIATYEAVRSRRGKRYMVDGRKAMAAAYPMFLVLMLIAVTSLYLDIVNPIDNPFR